MKITKWITSLAFVLIGSVSWASAGALIAEMDDDDEFEFKGIVQTLPDTPGRIGEWRVGGRTVHVNASTLIRQEERPVVVGLVVEVEGFLRPDGSVDAKKIKVDDDEGEFEFKGRIESFPGGFIGDWVIGGRTVHVTATTRIEQEEGPIAPGAFAEVQGFLRPDGSVDATKIEIEDEADEDEFEFKGMIESLPVGLIGNWIVSGRTVHVTAATSIKQKGGPAAVGAIVEVEGFLRSDGSIDARKIEVKSNLGGTRVNFKGTVASLPVSGVIGDWQVSGRTVHVSASTRIKQKHGLVAVGTAVKVKGIQLSDGSIEAQMIQVRK